MNKLKNNTHYDVHRKKHRKDESHPLNHAVKKVHLHYERLQGMPPCVRILNPYVGVV